MTATCTRRLTDLRNACDSGSIVLDAIAMNALLAAILVVVGIPCLLIVAPHLESLANALAGYSFVAAGVGITVVGVQIIVGATAKNDVGEAVVGGVLTLIGLILFTIGAALLGYQFVWLYRRLRRRYY